MEALGPLQYYDYIMHTYSWMLSTNAGEGTLKHFVFALLAVDHALFKRSFRLISPTRRFTLPKGRGAALPTQ